mmetsp:Transcript_31169/g.85753  ORF Transcript_31169/g.85753 Transcript_31169/m.85753 type:complete len:228 (+) Transcript_31169:960-1643(+)
MRAASSTLRPLSHSWKAMMSWGTGSMAALILSTTPTGSCGAWKVLYHIKLYVITRSSIGAPAPTLIIQTPGGGPTWHMMWDDWPGTTTFHFLVPGCGGTAGSILHTARKSGQQFGGVWLSQCGKQEQETVAPCTPQPATAQSCGGAAAFPSSACVSTVTGCGSRRCSQCRRCDAAAAASSAVAATKRSAGSQRVRLIQAFSTVLPLGLPALSNRAAPSSSAPASLNL